MNYLLKDASEFVLPSALNGTWELPGFVISVKGMDFATVVCGKYGNASDPIWLIWWSPTGRATLHEVEGMSPSWTPCPCRTNGFEGLFSEMLPVMLPVPPGILPNKNEKKEFIFPFKINKHWPCLWTKTALHSSKVKVRVQDFKTNLTCTPPFPYKLSLLLWYYFVQ